MEPTHNQELMLTGLLLIGQKKEVKERGNQI